jgi:hypothetical protein
MPRLPALRPRQALRTVLLLLMRSALRARYDRQTESHCLGRCVCTAFDSLARRRVSSGCVVHWRSRLTIQSGWFPDSRRVTGLGVETGFQREEFQS